jgi:hypothetical protein
MHSWGSAEPEGQWAQGGWYPGKLWDQLWPVVWHRWVVGIPVFVDPVVQLRGGYLSGGGSGAA